MALCRAIGLMSGTSMDGVDVALVETDGEAELAFGPTGFLPYGDADRALLRAALAEAAGLEDRLARPGRLATAERMVTDRHAECVEIFWRDNGLEAASIDVVGFHGQTVLHRPKQHLTVQIGDGPGLARRLGVDVAYDFRAADVAAGGEGAPIVPVFHRALVVAAGMRGQVALLNIGGVANLTYIDDGVELIACDAGPGNALIDDLMLARTGAPIDRHGQTAARGRVNDAALARLLAHPFFELHPPKSLDRNAFSLNAISD
ncbi:MAG: anhydro-N-acetylmuramic acid kinase, partial [Methylocystis sp.]|nr:anhydro-N-acetylmuramic acid kinase [Methylocystis sp.]